jgi:hypothetical protein
MFALIVVVAFGCSPDVNSDVETPMRLVLPGGVSATKCAQIWIESQLVPYQATFAR